MFFEMHQSTQPISIKTQITHTIVVRARWLEVVEFQNRIYIVHHRRRLVAGRQLAIGQEEC